MRTFLRAMLPVLAAGLLPAGQPVSKPALTTLIYMVNRADAFADFRAHAPQTSIIAPQTFTMDAQGFVMGEVPPEVMTIAREHGVAVMPLVTNRGFNQPLMHTVLDAPELRARAIRYLLYYALRDGYAGFQFDYENIRYTYRDKFTVFFEEAAREFHRHHLKLSAAVVGRSVATRNPDRPGGWDDWSGVYDYERLGKAADFLSIMAYDQHTASSDPGPVAGLPWVRRIAEYSKSAIGAPKISLGVPFYGLRWEAATPGDPAAKGRKWRGRSTRYRDAAAALSTTPANWDETEQCEHLVFDTAGHTTEMWYEDARSLRAKLNLAHGMGFPGVSAWVLGQEDPGFWTLLDGWRVRHPRARHASGVFDARSRRAARALRR